MKKLSNYLLTALVCLGLTACSTTSVQYEKYKPLAVTVTVIVIKQTTKDNPTKLAKFVNLANQLELAASTVDKELTLEDFVKFGQRAGVDVEWSVLASTLYNIYKPNLSSGLDKIESAKVVLREVAKVIKDSVLILNPNK